MNEQLLPDEFADLERFTGQWLVGGSEPARYQARLAATMPQMTEFYDAAFGRLKVAMAYLDGFDLHALPPRELNLLHLMYTLITVALPVEVWGQPEVIDSGNCYFERNVEPIP